MSKKHWQKLRDELERWKDSGLVPKLWLRDDDAVEPTPQLTRLLDLTEAHGVPLALAIIPAPTDKELAERLRHKPLATPLIHGWAHANHAPPGAKKMELGLHRPLPDVLYELGSAIVKMRALYGERLDAILVPPWNRIDPNLILHLPQLGFTGLSTFGDAHRDAALPAINTHVDIIDWHGSRRCREPEELIADLVRNFSLARGEGRAVGILTHHLAHDDGAWMFLEELFGTCEERVQWRTAHSLAAPDHRSVY